jgi:polysaccharide biosynthesis/export protein
VTTNFLFPVLVATLVVPSCLLAQTPTANTANTLATPATVGTQSQDGSHEDAAGARFGERYPRYRLGAGDSFDLTFTYTPDFNQTVLIQPDGFIFLREIGELHLQGQTVAEATRAITQAYAKILREPVISIVLKDFEKPYFIFGGFVKNPGKYELRGRTTITQAVALAGGFTEAAKHSEVYLFRNGADYGTLVTKLNVKGMLKKADLTEDVALMPGDMLYVPQNAISKLKGFIIPRASVNPFPR